MFKEGTVLYTTFDEYKIIKQVGQGGNGTVFKAVNSDRTIIAIKAIEKNKATRDKLKRFKNEIEFCRKNKHKNIIEVLDNGTYKDQKVDCIFYVMPFYPKTLRVRIETGITSKDALEIFFNILCGVEFAHKQNAFHRDIKPENILFKENSNEAVIADFGIAHFSKDDMVTAVETNLASRLANFQYAAPEQRERNGIVDGRADVFAMGLILNEMFTKQIVSGVKHNRIVDVDEGYDYLDLLFDEMVCQNPNDRLFPIEKVLFELKLLSEKKQNELELKRLLDQKNTAEIANNSFPTPQLVDINFVDKKLTLIVEPSVPHFWTVIFQSCNYSYRSIIGKEPKRFFVSHKGNEFSIDLNYDDENEIKTIISCFKEWLKTVTNLYNQQVREGILKEQREKETARLKAINDKEKEMRIKASLKDLL